MQSFKSTGMLNVINVKLKDDKKMVCHDTQSTSLSSFFKCLYLVIAILNVFIKTKSKRL